MLVLVCIDKLLLHAKKNKIYMSSNLFCFFSEYIFKVHFVSNVLCNTTP